jgi:hypothetical protein
VKKGIIQYLKYFKVKKKNLNMSNNQRVNLSNIGNSIIKYKRAFRNLQDMRKLPSYSINFSIENFNEKEVKTLLDLFGWENFKYLEGKVNEFNKSWIYLNSGEFIGDKEIFDVNNKNGLILFNSLKDEVPKHYIEVPRMNFYPQPIPEKETADLKSVMEYDYLKKTKFPYGRTKVDFNKDFLCLDTISNNLFFTKE